MSGQPNTDFNRVMETWAELLPFDPPDKFTVNLMLRQHGLETTLYAIEQVATKRAKLNGQMEREYAMRLCGAICCSMTRLKQQPNWDNKATGSPLEARSSNQQEIRRDKESKAA